MEIFEYEQDKTLVCRFRGHNFNLSRDPGDGYSFGNWYMIVIDDSGAYACDGWIDDSSSYGIKRAMDEACNGALVEPPKRWPKIIKKDWE
jgi:hypothetical protein